MGANVFAARDYADVIDPRRVQHARLQMRTRARSQTVKRLREAHQAEYDAIFAEEFAKAEETFNARLASTIRRAKAGAV